MRFLFVCVENSCRSQLAEACARMLGAEAYSAGSRPSGRVNPKAVAAMREVGYDLSTHASQGFESVPGGAFDAIVTMGCGDDCPEIETDLRLDWPIPDPKHLPAEEFRLVREEIRRRVAALVAGAP